MSPETCNLVLSVRLKNLFVRWEILPNKTIVQAAAVKKISGWIGVLLIVIGAVVSGYTGVQLGRCWVMLQKLWPEYKLFCRKPYPEIGKRAVGGEWMRFDNFNLWNWFWCSNRFILELLFRYVSIWPCLGSHASFSFWHRKILNR